MAVVSSLDSNWFVAKVKLKIPKINYFRIRSYLLYSLLRFDDKIDLENHFNFKLKNFFRFLFRNQNIFQVATVSCTFCPKMFLTRRRFYVHANVDHFSDVSERWIRCETCATFRPTNDVMSRHKSVHSTEQNWAESFRCEFCPGVFSRWLLLADR